VADLVVVAPATADLMAKTGPTHEPIDPVRYIANRSSGKQGHAIAAHLARLGAEVTLVSGPVTIPDPAGVNVIHVESAREMLDAVTKALPADIAVFVPLSPTGALQPRPTTRSRRRKARAPRRWN
jgi:phosphopantothenoylcysteine decarboxylase/phosphopantothenate--cysteine ligase